MNKKKCVNIAVLTVSDTRTEEDDRSGQLLADRVTDAGHHLVEKKIIGVYLIKPNLHIDNRGIFRRKMRL